MMRLLPLFVLLSACNGAVTHERIPDRDGHVVVELDRCDGLKEGPVTVFRANGSRSSQGSYHRDRQDGWWRSYHANGVARSLTHFTDGVKDGLRIYWDSTGRILRAEQFLRGVPNGPFLRVYPDGKPAERSTYADGLLEGEHDHWFKESGGSWLHGYFHQGLETGTWTERDNSGRTIWQAEFNDGALVRTISGRRRRH